VEQMSFGRAYVDLPAPGLSTPVRTARLHSAPGAGRAEPEVSPWLGHQQTIAKVASDIKNQRFTVIFREKKRSFSLPCR